jgi:hypothetical protein
MKRARWKRRTDVERRNRLRNADALQIRKGHGFRRYMLTVGRKDMERYLKGARDRLEEARVADDQLK